MVASRRPPLYLLLLLHRNLPASGLFRNPHVDPLQVSVSDAFSPRLSEAAMVKQPSAILVSHDESHVFVSSFLNDAVLRAPLPLTMGSRFGIFAQGSYCTRDLSTCAVLNGPWGLAADHAGRLFVASFGSDQVLVFSDEGEFIGAVGDSESLDSPEGLALSPDGETLVVASFLDSRIVAFDVSNGPFLAPDRESRRSAGGGGRGSGGSVPWWTVAEGTPVDLEYMVARVEARLRREQQQQQQDKDGGGGGGGGGGGAEFDPILDDPAAATGDAPLSLDLLHGPEDIVFLEGYSDPANDYYRSSSSSSSSSSSAGGSNDGDGDDDEKRRRRKRRKRVSGRIAVSSHYNRSILVLDLSSGAVEEVMYGVEGALDVPMGLAVDDKPSSASPSSSTSSSSTVLLCTSYSSREPGLVARFVGGAYAGVAMSSKYLAGPSAIQILRSDGSVLVASYDTNAILVFNRTASAADDDDADRELVLRASGSMRKLQEDSARGNRQQQRPTASTSNKQRRKQQKNNKRSKSSSRRRTSVAS